MRDLALFKHIALLQGVASVRASACGMPACTQQLLLQVRIVWQLSADTFREAPAASSVAPAVFAGAGMAPPMASGDLLSEEQKLHASVGRWLLSVLVVEDHVRREQWDCTFLLLDQTDCGALLASVLKQ